MQNSKCKICRSVGTKLFLKGERCLSLKCAFVRKPYPPGKRGKRGKRRTLSAFGKELREKQKLKKWYNLKEGQFSNYVKRVLEKKGKVADTSELLIGALERRLDNVVFRVGFASSRPQARQLVSHGYFLVNGKKNNIPSYQVKEGDVISLVPGFEKKGVFKNLSFQLKGRKIPNWISFNIKKLEAKVEARPSFEEAAPPAEVSAVFEYYSR